MNSLAIITERRVLELNERARDNARAHYEYANQRYQGGLGSRLNAVHLLLRLSLKESPSFDPFPLARAEAYVDTLHRRGLRPSLIGRVVARPRTSAVVVSVS